MKIACIIPTYNGKNELCRLLSSLSKQALKFDIFIVDSSSVDGTLEVAQSSDAHVVTISSSNFNHGGTRQMMVEQNPEYDIYIFMTQDAYLTSADSFSRLIKYFDDSSVGAVCGRQLPHLDADHLSRHARKFNYPEESIIKDLDSIPLLGIKSAFMSNSFAAYRKSAFLDAGGFPDHVILSEDMYLAAKMLLQGWKVAYSGEAVCRHSHNYSITEEFRRYFDIGVFHARENWIRDQFGGAGSEGMRFIKSELQFLGLRFLYLWPAALSRNFVKLLAYKIGQNEGRLPVWLKKRFSMHKAYWDGPFSQLPSS